MEVDQFNVPSRTIDGLTYACESRYSYVTEIKDLPVLGHIINAHLIDRTRYTGEIQYHSTSIKAYDRILREYLFDALLSRNEENNKWALVFYPLNVVFNDDNLVFDSENEAWEALDKYTAIVCEKPRRDYMRQQYNNKFDLYGMYNGIAVPRKTDW